MIVLSIIGVIVCLVLLAIAVYLPIHVRHPLEFLAGGGLAIVALTGIALIIHVRDIVLAWLVVIFIGGCCWPIYQNIWGRRKRAPESGSANSPT